MFNLKNLDEHLDSNEKVLLFFRPSRKAYLAQYFFIVLLVLVAVWLSSLVTQQVNVLILLARSVGAYAVFLFAIILFIRVEYRIWSRKYALTTERILYSRGIFSETFMSANYSFITDIRFHQSFWDKLMNTGTLAIDTAGTDTLEIRYRKINDPLKVKRMINDAQNINTSLPQKKRAQSPALRKKTE